MQSKESFLYKKKFYDEIIIVNINLDGMILVWFLDMPRDNKCNLNFYTTLVQDIGSIQSV